MVLNTAGDGCLYDRIFKRLEAVRWKTSDIPLDDIDRTLVDEKTLDLVSVNCLLELSSLYAEEMFIRDFYDDIDFCQFISIWYYEEMKHYLVLKEYLGRFDRAPLEAELASLRISFDRAPWPSTLTMHFCGEQRLGMWYHRWSEHFQEPVLQHIYRTIGNDEIRHAGCYEEFMAKALRRDPRVLLDFLQMAKWMLVNPEKDKHPTTTRVNGEGRPSVLELIPGHEVLREALYRTISDADEDRLRQRVLATLSHLSGHRFATMHDLMEVTRTLRQEMAPAPPP